MTAQNQNGRQVSLNDMDCSHLALDIVNGRDVVKKKILITKVSQIFSSS
jgi:hypothetical protein